MAGEKPFELLMHQAKFREGMNDSLRHYLNKFLNVYLDDILVCNALNRLLKLR